MNSKKLEKAYEYAQEMYAEIGIDTNDILKKLSDIKLSMQCWQGDDVTGFEQLDFANSDMLATGNYVGKARTANELRADCTEAFRLIPGNHKLNLHASYADYKTPKVERNELTPEHFTNWVEWAKSLNIGLDFNPTYFSHPLASDGFTLSHIDDSIRDFWIEHGKRSRKIGEYFGKECGMPCVTNLWIPDGFKDIPIDRLAPRKRLEKSLDEIFSDPIDNRFNIDSLESKLFGIGTESYVVGSHEFYFGYAVKNQKILCLDSGHFHPSENVADKISSVLLHTKEVLLHLSRGIRWDSDHVVILDDQVLGIAEEIIKTENLNRIHIGLDYFDPSINRVAAWVIGMRTVQKALLKALLTPINKLKNAENHGDFTARIVMQEEAKSLPWTSVWDYFCLINNVPIGMSWFSEIKKYEETVFKQRLLYNVPELSKKKNIKSDLIELVNSAHFLGLNSSYVQAGGGNVSIKCADHQHMLIKASGTAMANMSIEQGWVKVNLDTINSMFNDKFLNSKTSLNQERQIESILSSAVVGQSSERASVETPLHALLERVVFHSHPVAVTALTCHTDGKSILRKISQNSKNIPLWVPYTDPGFTLAKELFRRISAYKKYYLTNPQVIFLQNHGFICTAESVEECMNIHLEWMGKIEQYFKYKKQININHEFVEKIKNAVLSVFKKAGDPKPEIFFSRHKDLSAVSYDNREEIFEGALTPDQIVYTGPAALVISQNDSFSTICENLNKFKKKHLQFPTLIIIKNVGMMIVASSLKRLQDAEKVAVSIVQASSLADNNFKFMNSREVDFILNWEAEHYRKSL